jgi:hypothetical protein
MSRFDMNDEFFSGSQASIFIGDIWVDEITDWQCSVAANAQPIYGYGDTFFSHAAQGRVLVQGSFSINFKEPNYIYSILARYRTKNDLGIARHATQESTYTSSEYKFGDDAGSFRAPTETGYEDKRKSLDDFFYQRNDVKGEESFNREGINQNNISGVINNNIRGGSTLSTLDPRLVNDFAVPLFDIKIGYGAVLNADTIGEQLIGVKLVGKGRTIMANGQPIKETYSFFAKNLV